jgi:hypothetical protein
VLLVLLDQPVLKVSKVWLVKLVLLDLQVQLVLKVLKV